MSKRTIFLVLLAFGFFTLALSSCDDDNGTGNARLEIRLTDAPGDYQEVNVDIQEIRVHASSDDRGDDDSGWQSLAIHKGVYDLTKLTNGIDTLLCSVELPAGKISQIRLVLGDNNSVRVDGQLHPLKTPSAQQSGLKVQVNEQLKEGITYRVLLDFDAALSVVARGNGEYNLKPVIRSITEPLDGAIAGTVLPVDATATVFAIIGTDTTSTFTDPATGAFRVGGLTAGNYRVVLAAAAGYGSKEISNVTVTNGDVATIGVVELEHL